MSDSVITQVGRGKDDKKNASNRLKGARRGRWSFLGSIFCCWQPRSRNNRRTPDPKPQTTASQQWPSHPDPGRDLLPAAHSHDTEKKCLVLDLDETLVHSSFTPVPNPDFVVPIEIEGKIHHVYVLKRPHVDSFLKRVGELFEVVLFTASLSKYAEPVSALLDTHRVFRHLLFRQDCVYHRGSYVKDLSRLGRDVNQCIIVDNSPASYIFHPENAVAIESWFDDPNDTELLDLIPFFEDVASVLDREQHISTVLR